ncbi:MAG: hypothetical protein O7E55_05550 [Chloroflexi bacterium]|nr:hypothetical protein [Chloroflexota bacterium]
MDNQFGKEQRLKVGRAVGLFVPSQKFVTYSDGSSGFAPTTDLDHFKCYSVKGESVKQMVQLGDELIKMTPAGVYAPSMLCNPVVKVHATDGSTAVRTNIQNPDDHLVCYKVRMAQSTHEVMFHNQFEPERTTVIEGPNLLCVPSLKRHLTDGNGGKGGRGGG